MAKRLHVLSDIDPTTRTATCRHCGPQIPLVLRQYSVGPTWVCRAAAVARSAKAAAPKYSDIRRTAMKAYNARQRRVRRVQRVLRDLSELTMEELETVLKAIPNVANEPDDADTLPPEPCTRCKADGFPSCECWLTEDHTGTGFDAIEAI